MDIKSKLRLIDSLSYKNIPAKIQDTQANTVTPRPAGFANVIYNTHGNYSQINKIYPPDFKQGDILLSNFNQKPPALLAVLSNIPDNKTLDLSKAIFLDTETTGLSGGVGTCAFLIGVGFFEDGQFRLIQFFMNDFDEEAALLHDLEQLMQSFDLLISYNGKAYDVPLLNSRYICQGLKSPFSELEHIDLLHIVRRLWKHRLPECSLNCAEFHITKTTRQGDVPGYIIPYIFFDYLRNKNTDSLAPVFYHNQQDILSMVALITRGLEFLEKPLEACQHPFDILRIGNILENACNYESANRLYGDYLVCDPENTKKRDFLIRMALNYKRLNNWREAEVKWLECVESQSYHPMPYIELAKHYEHRKRNLSKAKYYVEKALGNFEVLGSLNRNGLWLDYKHDLTYRLARLGRKLQK